MLVERLHAHIDRVEAHLEEGAEPAAGRASDRGPYRPVVRDVAVIAGIALTMLGIKALKLLPGIPFAPGHKGVLLIPLFIAAGYLTRSRAGSTLTGLTMGTVAFLLGDGRYGVFEICKHIAPGVLVDLGMPLLRGRAHRVWAWSLFGLVVALGRFATVTAIALVVQAPAVVYAVLVPGLAVHLVFGTLSGIVTAPLVRALAQGRDRTADGDSRAPGGGGGGHGGGGGRGRGRGQGGGGGGGRGRGGGHGRAREPEPDRGPGHGSHREQGATHEKAGP